MIAFKIRDIKKMMQTLLYSESFDAFSLQEATVTKAATLILEGRINPSYYTQEDLYSNPDLTGRAYIAFKEARPILGEYIKGDHTPISFKIVLQASAAFVEKLVKDPDFSDDPDNVKALILTFRFENGVLTCLTGTSTRSFSLDKSLDKLWDARIRKSLSHMQISFDEL